LCEQSSREYFQADSESSSNSSSDESDEVVEDAVAYYMKERERVLGPSEGGKFNWDISALSDHSQVRNKKQMCEKDSKFAPAATSSPKKEVNLPHQAPRGHPSTPQVTLEVQSPVADRIIYTGPRDWEIGGQMGDLLVISVKIKQSVSVAPGYTIEVPTNIILSPLHDNPSLVRRDHLTRRSPGYVMAICPHGARGQMYGAVFNHCTIVGGPINVHCAIHRRLTIQMINTSSIVHGMIAAGTNVGTIEIYPFKC
jgi:hypothetical protein